MGSFIDIAGEVFGHWEVLERAPNQGKTTMWHCECKLCGNIYAVQRTHLRSGKSTKCRPCLLALPIDSAMMSDAYKLKRAAGQLLGVKRRWRLYEALIDQTAIGLFGTATEAAKAHDAKARELYGSTAIINFKDQP